MIGIISYVLKKVTIGFGAFIHSSNATALVVVFGSISFLLIFIPYFLFVIYRQDEVLRWIVKLNGAFSFHETKFYEFFAVSSIGWIVFPECRDTDFLI